MTNIEPLLTNVFLNTFWQSFTVGLVGLLILTFMRRRAAAERALSALCVMIVLAILPAVNFAWQKYASEWKARPGLAAEAVSLSMSQATIIPTKMIVVAPTEPVSLPNVASEWDWEKYAAATVWPLSMIWAVGTLLLLGRLFYGLIFLRGFRFGLKPVSDPKVDAALLRAAEILSLRHMPPVFTSPAATSPLTVGIFRPVMILPEKLLGSLSENETLSIVLHEFSHVWRKDHLVGIFKRLILAVNWWNPAVYFISNAHSDAAEELSDNCALLHLKPEDYSECLLRLAEKTDLISRLPATIGMAVRRGGLHQRVLKLLSGERKIEMKTTIVKKFAAAMIAVIAILVLGGAGCVFVQNTTEPTPQKSMTYWEKYQIWDVLRKGGNDYIVKDDAKEQQLLQELTQGIWVVKFKPVNGFKPRNPHELIKEFNVNCPAQSGKNSVGGASFFRTTVSGNNVLVGSFLSETPEKLKADLGKSSTIQLISIERMTPELFVKYVNTKQESLPLTPAQQAQLPTVVETFPCQGETVDANKVKEIRVTFSRDMNTMFTEPGYACHFDNSDYYPYSFFINMRWIDKRTMVTPVFLLPGRTYSIWFNPGHKFGAFTDISGQESVPCHLVFKTAGSSAETSDDLKPKVVDTFPQPGALVDAATVKEIRVTFSEDMLNRDGAWSTYFGSYYFPQPSGSAYWLNSRTWIYPVKLESGKDYSICLNMGKSLRNFVSKSGNSSIPYQLGFKTTVKEVAASKEQKPELAATTVVDTFPRQGETVDAATVKEVRVTFSNDMNTGGGWAFCSEGDNYFPDSNEKPHWLNKRTCAMSVKLLPGRTYSVSFNAGRFNSFRDAQKRSSVPYKLTFKTTGTSAETSDVLKPTVVNTFPRHGELVEASTVKEIRVTFSEDMNTDGYWSIGNNEYIAFPMPEGKIHWLDQRTCVIPVSVKPGTAYAIWFNMGKSYRNFVSKSGNSSLPYELSFTTIANDVSAAKKANKAEMIAAATVAAEEWLALIEAGKIQESWKNTAEYFRRAVTVDAWAEAMKSVRVPLGKMLFRKVASATYSVSPPGAPDGNYVIIQFKTSFSNKKEAIETVTPMLESDGQWRVAGYYVK